MENFLQKNTTIDTFTFPNRPAHDHELEFEFGSITPCTPNSPADHLFVNGHLLPHDFPCPPVKSMSITLLRSTSRTSSVSSKDTLMWCRSNSTSSGNSTGSCCNSARTSVSDASERKIFISRTKNNATRNAFEREIYKRKKPVLTPQYGCQRWQFITQTPVLSRKVSCRTKAQSTGVLEDLKWKKQAKAKKMEVEGSGGGFSVGLCLHATNAML